MGELRHRIRDDPEDERNSTVKGIRGNSDIEYNLESKKCMYDGPMCPGI